MKSHQFTIGIGIFLACITLPLLLLSPKYEWRCTKSVEIAVIHSMERVSKRGRLLTLTTTEGDRITYETSDSFSVGDTLCLARVREKLPPEPVPDKRLKSTLPIHGEQTWHPSTR